MGLSRYRGFIGFYDCAAHAHLAANGWTAPLQVNQPRSALQPTPDQMIHTYSESDITNATSWQAVLAELPTAFRALAAGDAVI